MYSPHFYLLVSYMSFGKRYGLDVVIVRYASNHQHDHPMHKMTNKRTSFVLRTHHHIHQKHNILILLLLLPMSLLCCWSTEGYWFMILRWLSLLYMRWIFCCRFVLFQRQWFDVSMISFVVWYIVTLCNDDDDDKTSGDDNIVVDCGDDDERSFSSLFVSLIFISLQLLLMISSVRLFFKQCCCINMMSQTQGWWWSLRYEQKYPYWRFQ